MEGYNTELTIRSTRSFGTTYRQQKRALPSTILAVTRILLFALGIVCVWEGTVQSCLADTRCEVVDCGKIASYGLRGTKTRRFCLTHKKEGHVNVVGKYCEYVSPEQLRVRHPARAVVGDAEEEEKEGARIKCERRAYYGIEGDGVRRCSKHVLPGMVNLLKSTCKAKGCRKQPCFGFPGQKTEFCNKHKQAGQVDVLNRHCKSCTKQACFGDAKTKKAEFCAAHRPVTYVDLTSKRCAFKGCTTQPFFGDPDDPKRSPRWCAEHRKKHHLDIKNRRCVHPHGCMRHPSYGDALEGLAKYCAYHRSATDVDLKNNRCQSPRCAQKPSYAQPGAKRPRFCEKHRESLHVFVPRLMAPKTYRRKKQVGDGVDWGSYVEPQEQAPNSIIWRDAARIPAIYEDTFLLLLAESHPVAPAHDPPAQIPSPHSTDSAELLVLDAVRQYSGPNSTTLQHKCCYYIYRNREGLAAQIHDETGSLVWDREASLELLERVLGENGAAWDEELVTATNMGASLGGGWKFQGGGGSTPTSPPLTPPLAQHPPLRVESAPPPEKPAPSPSLAPSLPSSLPLALSPTAEEAPSAEEAAEGEEVGLGGER